MHKISAFNFYTLGRALGQLVLMEDGDDVEDWYCVCRPAHEHLTAFLSDEELSISSSLKDAGQLFLGVLALFLPDGEVKGTLRGSPTFLGVQLVAFEAVLFQEFDKRLSLYRVAKKGIYDTLDLIDHAELALPKRLLVGLPAIVLDDLQQGGRCLAFETPTAAGFHLLRAVEGLIKAYYEKLAGAPWPHKKRDWGFYTDEIKKIGAPERLTGALTHMKDNYRNPLMHPQDTLDQEEALSLFGVVVSLVTLILQEIVP